jgi:hypothetical protein
MFVSVDGDGEGIVAACGPDGLWIPLVAADRQRVERLRPIARRIGQETGATIRLIRFTTRTELEVIEPKEGREVRCERTENGEHVMAPSGWRFCSACGWQPKREGIS